MGEEFECERCGFTDDDDSYAPLCPDCYWEEQDYDDWAEDNEDDD